MESRRKIDLACIIDDDEAYTYTAGRLIKRRQMCRNLMVFSDGSEALEYLTAVTSNPEQIPEIILLDINMPVMDGWEFMERFSQMRSDLPRQVTVFMVSSSTDPADMERAKKIQEIAGYIVKPVTEEELAAVFLP